MGLSVLKPNGVSKCDLTVSNTFNVDTVTVATLNATTEVSTVNLSSNTITSPSSSITLLGSIAGDITTSLDVGTVTANNSNTNNFSLAGTTIQVNFTTLNARLFFSNPNVAGGQQYYADLPLTAN